MAVNSGKIRELIEKSSNVIIVAHKDIDLDALGSCLGMYYACAHLDKRAYILIDDKEFENGVKRAIDRIIKLDYNVNIEKLDNIKDVIDGGTLLIVVDINRKDLIQNEEVLNLVKNRIVIDHHIQGNNIIEDTEYEYVNIDESSTTEIIMDIVTGLEIYIPQYISTIMLAGIVIDTNSFFYKTTERTYTAAALLNRFGADTTELQYLLKQDFKEYIERQKIILNTQIINDEMAIALGNPKTIYEKSELAKTADTILQFSGIEASFVIGRTNENEVSISARSLGEINVQRVMKRLNGGGHLTEAATQLKGVTIEEAKDMLLKIIIK